MNQNSLLNVTGIFCIVLIMMAIFCSSPATATAADDSAQDAVLGKSTQLGKSNATIKPPAGWENLSVSKDALLLVVPPDRAHGASINAFFNTKATRDLSKLKEEIVKKRAEGRDKWELIDSEQINLDGYPALLMSYSQDVADRGKTNKVFSIGCYVDSGNGLYVLNFNCHESGFESLGPTARKSLLSFSLDEE